MTKYTEDTLEKATLDWLSDLGYRTAFGPDIAPDSANPERSDYSEVILSNRLKSAIAKLNPKVPDEVQDEAFRKVVNIANQSPKLEVNNRDFHKLLAKGIEVEYKTKDGSMRGDKVYLLDKDDPENNDWLAVNQFTIIENKNNRRPDVVVFVNGIPIAIFELKNPADIKATIKSAHNQFQTYKNQIPLAFTYNQILIITDGHNANLGTITSPIEWFLKWRTVDGKVVAPKSQNELKVMINGVFEKSRFLDIITNFITFEENEGVIIKKLSGYHQYHATNKAVEKTIKATKGNKKVGVIWHTQGSGKSLTMAFYTGKIIQELDNPTVVVITDRNDLDDQLFATFQKSKELFGQIPKQAKNRDHLKDLLKVSSGGVVFTTIQKFFPEDDRSKYPLLSKRKNIVVIADEAHRSHYGFKAKVGSDGSSIKYGLAKYIRDALPNASFIGFTATPIALKDKNTVSVFGNVIDTYDITRAVEDEATVPIFYEARLVKIDLPPKEKEKIDKEFAEITEGEEPDEVEKLKGQWARLEAMVGTENRLRQVAKDIVNHFEDRLSAIKGKGMIVTMSRRIAVDLYKEIIKLKPEWHNDSDEKGSLKVVITGSASDPQEFQQHIRNKASRDNLAIRFKDSKDEFKLVIVCDMWLTGFDAPCLHTMYIDKLMKGHGLMQAIARVNRVYKDKKAGLVVDYIGFATQLQKALSYYSLSDRNITAIPQEEAVKVLKEKFEIVKEMFHGFNYKEFFSGKETQRTEIQTEAIDFILREVTADRYHKAIIELSEAFSIAIPHPEAIKIRDEIAFFQAIDAGIQKLEPTEKGGPLEEDYDHAIRQIVTGAIVSNKVIDIFQAAGLDSPNISILSEEFLESVKEIKHKNLALEVLKKLINDQLKVMTKTNLVVSRKLSEMLENIIKQYQDRTIEAAQVILQLIELAKKVKEEQSKGKKMNLSKEEVAFYDALAMNESALELLGDKTLHKMSKELVKLLRKNTSIDWTIKETVQAKLRIYIKRLLKEYDYPPDKQELATKTVLDQAELLAKDWEKKR